MDARLNFKRLGLPLGGASERPRASPVMSEVRCPVKSLAQLLFCRCTSQLLSGIASILIAYSDESMFRCREGDIMAAAHRCVLHRILM